MTPPLLLVPVGSQRWRLEQTWTAHGVTVPAGFQTDLASIPWWCGWLLKRNDIPWIVAGVLHDWHYWAQHRSRLTSDRLLRDVARAEGAPAWHCHIVYAAVRLFGWPSWRRSRRS
jgi:thiosulfate reductase cytochrome b subunit